MTLSFTQTINGKPNYFLEKIWEGLLDQPALNLHYSYSVFGIDYHAQLQKHWDGFASEPHSIVPKLHTIRQDAHNSWRSGMDIHMVVKPKGRFSSGFQFAPVIKCVSVQEIRIVPAHEFVSVGTDCGDIMHVLSESEVKQLAINDGFDTVEDFFAYFNKDFTGKIIHWTNLKY